MVSSACKTLTARTPSANRICTCLQTLANSMSVALENARLFDETQRLLKETEQRAAELAAVNTVSAALVGELDLKRSHPSGRRTDPRPVQGRHRLRGFAGRSRRHD